MPRILTFRHLAVLLMALLCGLMLTGLTALPSDPTNTKTTSTEDSTVAQECVLTFHTGRKITGILTQSNEDSIVLRINGIDTTYRRTQIASVKFLPPVETRYVQLRNAIADKDIDARLMLVDWLRNRRAYKLALEELNSILKIEPHNSDAKTLKIWLDQHLKLASHQSKKTTKRPTRTHSVANPDPVPLLTEEQINIIRVFEIDLANPPKLRIEDTTIRELMTRFPDKFPVDESQRQDILDQSDLQKLKLLFRHKARDLYDQITVLEDPVSFQGYKKNIGGRGSWIINGCATARCHGNPDTSRLTLNYRNSNSPESLYTNFLILDRFQLKDGTDLINHTDPERSPLVHMGLIRSRSLYPHPDIDPTLFGRDWKPVFRTTKSANFTRTVDWIRSLYLPRPDYGIQYPPPLSPSPSETQNPSDIDPSDPPDPNP